MRDKGIHFLPYRRSSPDPYATFRLFFAKDTKISPTTGSRVASGSAPAVRATPRRQNIAGIDKCPPIPKHTSFRHKTARHRDFRQPHRAAPFRTKFYRAFLPPGGHCRHTGFRDSTDSSARTRLPRKIGKTNTGLSAGKAFFANGNRSLKKGGFSDKHDFLHCKRRESALGN